MPVIIPVTIAAYSIVGEKNSRSLEPLLATPITTIELLTGKSLAAAIPGILVTWAALAVFLLGARFVIASPVVFARLLGTTWLLGIFGVGPLITVLAVNMSVIVSSRVNDSRVAEQLSMVVIVPLLALLFGQIADLIFLNEIVMIILVGLLIVADAGVGYLSVQLFQRETILTRWK